MDLVVIERDATARDHPEKGKRVFVAQFGNMMVGSRLIFGSTHDVDQAARFRRKEAKAELERGRWGGLNPTLKEA